MSAQDLLILNHPIHAVAWAIGMLTIAFWIGLAFWFTFVGVVHQIQRLFRERLRDDSQQTFPLRGL